MPQAAKQKVCPTCFLTERDDRRNCVNRQNGMCPNPVDFTGDTMVEVVCDPCGKHLAIPLGNIMKRRQLTNLGTCSYDVCRARVVTPSVKPAKPSPPPISGDAPGK